MHQEQAKEVLRQINGVTLMAVGAREKTILTDGKLSFRITISRNVRHYIVVELTAADDYTVQLKRVKRDGTLMVEMQADGIYCDEISEVVYRMGHPKFQKGEWFAAVGIKMAAELKAAA